MGSPLTRFLMEVGESVGRPSDTNSIALLKEFACDREPIVAESCQVALDMIEFELLDNSFEVSARRRDGVRVSFGEVGTMSKGFHMNL